MIFDHPNYPGLRVYASGEKAHAGAFFSTIQGKVLSKIAAEAYGDGKLNPTLRINNSKWNQLNCIYRSTSGNCNSAIVPGSQAEKQKTWNPGAWLALCPKDKNELALSMGLTYQVIWVPTVDGLEPGDLVIKVPEKVPAKTPLPGTGLTIGIPGVVMPGIEDIEKKVKGMLPGLGSGTGGDIDDGGATGGGEPEPGVPEEPVKAGFPWWIAIILGGTILGTIWYTRKEGKK